MSEQNLTPETEESDVVPEQDNDVSADAEITVAQVEADAVAEWNTPTTSNDWLTTDIDAALAAVASLSEMMPEREAEAEARADAAQVEPAFVPQMAAIPPLTILRRGQLGSVVPALLMIGIGAWLTLSLTSGAPPAPLLIAAVVIGAVVLSLLSQWLSAGRWLRGALFFALLILFTVGFVWFSLQPDGLNFAQGYPLLFVVLALALALTGLLARPVNTRILFPAVLLALGGIAGLGATLGVIPANLTAIAPALVPVVFAAVIIVALLPFVFRRRS